MAIGLMPTEFYSMSFYEYTCILSGYIMRIHQEDRRMRLICHTIYLMNTASKSPLSAQAFMPFKYDAPIKDSVTTPEEKQALSNKAMELAKLLPKK